MGLKDRVSEFTKVVNNNLGLISFTFLQFPPKIYFFYFFFTKKTKN